MDYGTDFLLVDDDIVFTADGDIEPVSGPACVAQDIDQEIKLLAGSLPWDKDAGSSIPLMLNDTAGSAAAIIAELERIAIADPRVDPASVKAVQTAPGMFRLDFTPLGAVRPEALEYDLNRDE
jgi:hypothetical protein